ncbi:MAG TPA: helix-turn-helix domain-containing protein [Candidatus Dormibacteraeota bacterium]|nr:helix-turn-helix domain-containing protein [Candidatus Dormibacteraeota bacterium]
MMIGERLRALREAKGLTQGDIQRLTGLLRPHISRTENDHTTPSVETLEKWARALDVPLYSIFYEGASPPDSVILPEPNQPESRRKDEQFMKTLSISLAKMDEPSRQLLLQAARRMASRGSRK